ncbi:MAG: Ig-like domain-containing protein [Sphingomonas taxi]
MCRPRPRPSRPISPPPAVPTLTIAVDGTSASGTGEAGATLILTGPGGAAVATIVVAADGSYTIPLVPPRVDGALFTATQADAAGNVSPAATAAAPDFIATGGPCGERRRGGAMW